MCSGWILAKKWCLSDPWINGGTLSIICYNHNFVVDYKFSSMWCDKLLHQLLYLVNIYFYCSSTEKTKENIFKNCHIQKYLYYFVVFLKKPETEWVIIVSYICLITNRGEFFSIVVCLNDSLELTSLSIACISQHVAYCLHMPTLRFSCFEILAIFSI